MIGISRCESKLVTEPRTQIPHDIHFGDITIRYPDGVNSSHFFIDVVTGYCNKFGFTEHKFIGSKPVLDIPDTGSFDLTASS